MAVAKSFQTFEILSEPYLVSGRQYVRVRNPKTGTERQVRWYTDAEYNKLYPDTKPISPQVNDAHFKTQKEVLGFQKGYITIFKGDAYAHIDWFRASIARYTRWWGWYIISTEEIPADLPDGLTPIQLPWESVGQDNGSLKPETAVREAVESLIYDEGTSEHIGKIGDRIEITVTVSRVIEIENGFGHSNMHIMDGEDGNLYVWTTASKCWQEGSVKTIRGTIKDHRIYKNQKQNVLTRCLER